jgi:hypothetical protein
MQNDANPSYSCRNKKVAILGKDDSKACIITIIREAKKPYVLRRRVTFITT